MAIKSVSAHKVSLQAETLRHVGATGLCRLSVSVASSVQLRHLQRI